MKLKFAFASALLLATSSAAFAAIVTVNHVYDPANLLQSDITGEALATPVTLGIGDTLDLTLTFTGGSTIFANNEDGFWGLLLTSGDSSELQTTGTLEFLGASANIVSGPIALAQNNAFVHLGSYYTSSLYRLDAAQISFTGLRQIITIDGDTLGAPREYDRVALTYFSGDVQSGGRAVPEPATLAMVLTSLGMLGAAARRRTRTEATVA
jgi:hypothetical protein